MQLLISKHTQARGFAPFELIKTLDMFVDMEVALLSVIFEMLANYFNQISAKYLLKADL